MDIFIIRHGECRGQIDPACTSPDSELTAKGEEQGRQTATRLIAEGITHLVSSPLVRALSTANALAATLTCAPIQVWLELREGWSGPLHQGFGRRVLQQRFPQPLLPPAITDDGWSHGNDTYEGMFTRSQQAIQRLQNEFAPNAHVAVVTHGGIGNYLLHALLHIAPTTPHWFEMTNCAISHVQIMPVTEQTSWPLYPPAHAHILCINDTSHLRSRSA
ncbi:MAG: histidine phosphatase family protein [Caldilineaceae bacterium]